MIEYRTDAGTGVTTAWVAGRQVENTPEAILEAWRGAVSLTRIEMAFALQSAGILDQAQALEFAGRTLPGPIEALIASLPEVVQPLARLKMVGATEFPRSDEMWTLLTQGEGWPQDADVDALFGWAS